MSDWSTTRRSVLQALLAASLVVNAGFSVAAYRHFNLTHSAVRQPLSAGADAPVVLATDLSGRRLTIGMGVEPTVIYVISPTCGWCARNTANMMALWGQKGDHFRFVGLALRGEGLKEYLSKNPLPFDVYVADAKTIASYGLGATPSTIVVSKDGKIARKFNGAFERSKATVEAFFGVNLPGLQP
jgi:hypothetical protein